MDFRLDHIPALAAGFGSAASFVARAVTSKEVIDTLDPTLPPHPTREDLSGMAKAMCAAAAALDGASVTEGSHPSPHSVTPVTFAPKYVRMMAFLGRSWVETLAELPPKPLL